LVPRLGPQSDSPKKIPQLKITAMPLRHTHVLTEHIITIREGKLTIKVPHPAAFALHKLLISHRRQVKEKAVRDKEAAFRILEINYKFLDIKRVWKSFTKKERKEILTVLEQEEREDIISMLSKEIL